MRKVPRIVVKCEICPNTFETTSRMIEIGRSRVCSRSCRDKLLSQTLKAQTPIASGKRCRLCGAPFDTLPYLAGPQKYCCELHRKEGRYIARKMALLGVK